MSEEKETGGCLVRHNSGGFTDEEVEILKQVAAQVSSAKPRQGKGAKRQCNFRLDAALMVAVEQRAAAQGVKPPQIVTWALLEYLGIKD